MKTIMKMFLNLIKLQTHYRLFRVKGKYVSHSQGYGNIMVLCWIVFVITQDIYSGSITLYLILLSGEFNPVFLAFPILSKILASVSHFWLPQVHAQLFIRFGLNSDSFSHVNVMRLITATKTHNKRFFILLMALYILQQLLTHHSS